MEFWEKEYLKVLDEVEQNKNSRKRRRNRPDQISKQWEEVVQEDGSILYVPKEKEFRKTVRRQKRISTLDRWLKVFAKIIIFPCLLAFLFYLLPNLKPLPLLENNTIKGVPGFPTLFNSYVDGMQMKNLIDTVSEIKDRQLQRLDTYAASNYFLSVERLDDWQREISEDLITLNGLVYHPSYSDFVAESIFMLETLSRFIEYSRSENWDLARYEHEKYNNALSAMMEALIAAFEKNGVEYYRTEGEVHFTCKNY